MLRILWMEQRSSRDQRTGRTLTIVVLTTVYSTLLSNKLMYTRGETFIILYFDANAFTLIDFVTTHKLR